MLWFHPQNGTDQEECCQSDYLMRLTNDAFRFKTPVLG